MKAVSFFLLTLYTNSNYFGMHCKLTEIISAKITQAVLIRELGAVHMSRASPANRADLSHENLFNNISFYLASWQAFLLLKAAVPFNFSPPEYLSHHRTRKNRVSPVNRASPAHMNSPLSIQIRTCGT